jgi:hypothetical protein
MLRLVALSLLALTGSAGAQDWSRSFGDGRAASYLVVGRSPGVLVAGAGRDRSSEAAVTALRKALTPSARLVMDAKALGAIADLDDTSIVKRASKLPVEVVVVVRVFGSERGRDTAVVTFFTKEGEPASAFSVEAGAPLTPRATNESGVSSEAATAIDSVLKNRSAPAPEDTRSPAQKEYDGHFIGFYETLRAKNMSEMLKSACPYQGSAHTPLCGADLYHALGRDDLARSVKTRSDARIGLITTGSILVLAGVITTIVGAASGAPSPTCFSNCGSYTGPDYAILGSGLGITGLGLAGIIGGAVIPKHPSQPEEIYERAREHNRALRARVALPQPAIEPIPN